MERNRRTSLQGVVVSDKMNKTIVVEVETHKRHPKYAKRVKYSSKYYVHDEKNEAKVGDVVTIMGCRPLSATKRFRLVSIDKVHQESIKEVLEAEKALEEQAEAEVKEEVKVEEPKVEAEVVEEKPAEEKPVEEKKPAAKKAPAKKAASKEEGEEKAPAKKPAAKKAPAKKAAAKAE
jgi:small subunit ribosomal protein S17